MPSRPSLVLAVVALLGSTALAQPEAARPSVGIREKPVTHFTLKNARLVVSPTKTIERGTIVVENGRITAIGQKLVPPAGSRIVDLDGHTVYAGFLDAYATIDAGKIDREKGAPHWNPHVTPQRRTVESISHDDGLDASLRGQGIVARLVAPDDGIVKGTSAVVLTADLDGPADVLAADVAQHLRLTIMRENHSRIYPRSPMGAVALARQAFLDTDWHRRVQQAHDRDPKIEPPEPNDALVALAPSLDGGLVVVDTSDDQFFLRADLFAREFDLNIAIRGSGLEYRRLEAVAATGRTVILPLDFPKPPDVSTTSRALDVSLERLMHWDHAPENPGRLAKAGVPIAFTTEGLDKTGSFLKQLRIAVGRGLDEQAALAALTTTPAVLYGVEDDLGTLAVGRSASFVVTDGPLFDGDTKIVETWVAGRRFEVTKPEPSDLRGEWKLVDGDATLDLTIAGTPGKPTGTLVDAKLEKLTLDDTRLTATFDAKPFGKPGIARFSAVVSLGGRKRDTLHGDLLWPDGTTANFSGKRVRKSKDEPAEPSKTKPDTPENASFPVNYPLGAFGIETTPEQPEWVVFRNATIWTAGKRGVIENGTLVLHDGLIHGVSAKELPTPDGAIVVDCEGGHLTPGLVDCHSHFATDGGVNEGTQAVTAEVRVGDFVDATDMNVYRQLAGGVTSSNILHGSSNPIGGQNQVVKLRWGALPEQMKFTEAPQGIKFALGENVKQSNWGDDFTTRYPQTRMGVEQLVRDELQAATEYRDRWAAWTKTKQGRPPRRDLELEAIAEILDGERWIHCHSYRQDEILALIRTLDDYDVTIGTFQHILEGYKVAEAMKKHGAMGSAFSDWWAYKFEVYDAIPFNGALMHEQGVVVSFNSDDREMARRLNQEAAKAVKYGKVPPEEALKFVTLNPARQLRIEKWVGSLEKGKHADVVLWSHQPLSNRARVLQTWIDGRRYFDRDEDLRERDELRRRRATLVQKILASGQEPAKPGEEKPLERELWPRYDEYCTHSRGAAAAK